MRRMPGPYGQRLASGWGLFEQMARNLFCQKDYHEKNTDMLLAIFFAKKIAPRFLDSSKVKGAILV